jgi:hypothetical protein
MAQCVYIWFSWGKGLRYFSTLAKVDMAKIANFNAKKFFLLFMGFFLPE